jgi:hypothetical protein
MSQHINPVDRRPVDPVSLNRLERSGHSDGCADREERPTIPPALPWVVRFAQRTNPIVHLHPGEPRA